jgi:uncharacterized caspase-like protein
VSTLATCDALEAFATALDTTSQRGAVASAPDHAPLVRTPAPAAGPTSAAAVAPAIAAAPPAPPSAFVGATPQPGSYALIIGIEHYRDLPIALGARTDAEGFALMVKQTLGLPAAHVRLMSEDHATRSDVLDGLSWLKMTVPPGGRIYFYFSGHGAPQADSSTYLLPYDGNPKNVPGSSVAMSQVMKDLSETQAHEVLAFVDSCFSGAGGRSVLPPGARPLFRTKTSAPGANVAYFAASAEDEISGNAPGESAGVFSKYLTLALGTGAADGNGDGQVSLQELNDWVSPRVARDAKQDLREQHPKLVVGKQVGGAQNFIVEYGLATK